MYLLAQRAQAADVELIITVSFRGGFSVTDARRTGMAPPLTADIEAGTNLAHALAFYLNRFCEADGTLSVWSPEQEEMMP